MASVLFAATSITAEGQATAPADERVAAAMTALEGQDAPAADAAATTLAKLGKPAMPALIADLRRPEEAVRARAAGAIRQILVADPAAAPNDHGKAHWEAQAARVEIGMTHKQVQEILPPWLGGGGIGSGQSSTEWYSVDDYWRVMLVYHNTKGLMQKPEIQPMVVDHWSAPPANFTGTWTAWYVNGQKSHEIEYRNGKYNGTFTTFHPNGKKCVEQHYVNHTAEGTDTGWYPDGRKMYEGTYRHGKQVGTWTHWHEDGQVKLVQKFGE
ncbi:MAG: hypothetical protein NTW19_14065 [Planctomycetota bacterium]|nr:hypothetical protein [Planctomycetota bacterium]